MRSLHWINDGYNEPVVINDSRLVVRPFTRRERMDFLASDPDFKLLSEAMQSRVVCGQVDVLRLPKVEWEALFEAIFPSGSEQEPADEENLRSGVKLYRKYPHLTGDACSHCQKFWFDPITGETVKDGDGPMERPEEAELLCQVAKCPMGSPESPLALSLRNQHAYKHFLECEAVGQFPNDPIVQRNAEIIRGVK